MLASSCMSPIFNINPPIIFESILFSIFNSPFEKVFAFLSTIFLRSEVSGETDVTVAFVILLEMAYNSRK